jgi:hypothetical protein
MREVTADHVKGVAPVTSVAEPDDEGMVLFGVSPLPPCPDAYAFSRMVDVAESTDRYPPVSAQRNESIVCMAAQFNQLPLQSGLVALEVQAWLAATPYGWKYPFAGVVVSAL